MNTALPISNKAVRGAAGPEVAFSSCLGSLEEDLKRHYRGRLVEAWARPVAGEAGRGSERRFELLVALKDLDNPFEELLYLTSLTRDLHKRVGAELFLNVVESRGMRKSPEKRLYRKLREGALKVA
ncbi:MAG: hypothetical protein V2A74_05210 [bacterium]